MFITMLRAADIATAVKAATAGTSIEDSIKVSCAAEDPSEQFIVGWHDEDDIFIRLCIYEPNPGYGPRKVNGYVSEPSLRDRIIEAARAAAEKSGASFAVDEG